MAKENEKTDGAAPQDAVMENNVQALNTLANMSLRGARADQETVQRAVDVLASSLGLVGAEPVKKEEKEEGDGGKR